MRKRASMRRAASTLRATALLLAWLAAAIGGRAHAQPSLAYERVVEGLSQPVDFAFAPDGRIFVADLRGTVRIVRDGALLPAPFVTLPVNATGERGLLGLALDPAFATNPYVYLYYTVEGDPGNPEGPKTNRLVRITANGDLAVPGSERVLLGTVQGTPAAPSCDDQPPGSDCLPVDTLSHV